MEVTTLLIQYPMEGTNLLLEAPMEFIQILKAKPMLDNHPEVQSQIKSPHQIHTTSSHRGIQILCPNHKEHTQIRIHIAQTQIHSPIPINTPLSLMLLIHQLIISQGLINGTPMVQ